MIAPVISLRKGSFADRGHSRRPPLLQGESQPWRFVATSAYHMPRAQRLFERAGLTVMAYPVDFQGEATRNLSVMDFVPSARAFKKTEMASRETIGRVYYGFKGFL